MEAELFRSIEARIQAKVPEFNYIRMWNNQVDKLREEGEDGAPIQGIWHPALMVEFSDPGDILQLGNGNQLYDPIDIRIHILHNEIDAGNGEMDQNLNVFGLKERVYSALQEFEPDGACAFFRIAEERDYDHTNLYHYVQTYRTNYMDSLMDRPFEGIPVNGQGDPSVHLDLEAEYDTDLDFE